MATTSEHRTSSASLRTPVVPDERRVVPVKWWAAAGAGMLAFEAFVLVRWVTGPYFHSVDPGPTPVPGGMKVALTFWQIALPIGGAGVLWWFAWRPWRREGRVPIEGLMALAFSTLWFQDPLSAYGGQWYAYNAWQVNLGSWVNSMPGWLSSGTPEHQVAFPVFIVPGAYIVVFTLVTVMGARIMRTARARWPRIGRLGLLGICFAVMAPFDVLFEGIIFMPMGSWEYPGGHWAIFPGTFHKYPLNEALTTGALFTGFAAIKYFADDRGLTWAERGADRLIVSANRRLAIRALAVTGLVSGVMIACYNVPNTWFGAHSTTWPRDIQTRSYLTYTCGEGPGVACPGPDVPLLRNDNSDKGDNVATFGRLYPPRFRYDR